MDVRCERCRVQYVFSEDQVGADGLTVRCSNCGHVFLVKKKALVVTVPVKPGELREAPVPTADLDRASPPPAAPPARPAAEKERPWTLRNLRGDLYPFKELSTLQKWIVERKAARDDEVSHLGGPWRRLGDMLELEPFFALVERAERAVVPTPRRAEPDRAPAPAEPPAQSTLIDFPPPRAVFPGPGHQPAPAKTDRFPLPADANRAEPTLDAGPSLAEASDVSLGSAPVVADEGPVLPAKLGPVSAGEPAWTAGSSQRPVEPAKPRRAAPKAARRAGALPLLVLLLAAAVAAVYFTNPGWLGVIASVRPGQDAPPAKPEPASPAPAPQAEPTPPARELTPPAPAEGAVPGTPAARPAEPSSGNPPTTSSNVPPAPRAAPPPAAPPPASAAVAAPPPAAPTPAAPSGSAVPAESPSAAPPTPGVTPPSASAQPSAEQAPAAAPKEAPAPAAGRIPQAPKAEAPPRRPAAVAQATEPRKPGGGGLKRLLADARRLRLRGKPEAALRTYGQAVEVDATNADALAGRGLCYLDLSRYEPAEASFQAALEADSRHAEALMGLAETYRYEGRRTEAVTYYQRYVAAHPDGEDAAAARNAIDALKE